MTSVAKFPRRKFLKTIGSAAVVAAIPRAGFGAQSQPPAVALFWEPGFPSIQGFDFTLEKLRQAFEKFAVSVLNERDLIAQLTTSKFDLLITPHGSAFPKRAWPAMLKYLRDGGNWLNLGGVPLSRPVVRFGSDWRAEAYQATYHKRLGITHSFAVDPAPIATYLTGNAELQNTFKAREIYELYVRLSSSNNEPDEAGSDGPHEGGLRALVWGLNHDGRPIAAPLVQVDRWVGDFAGGSWIFANFNGDINATALPLLATRAIDGAQRFEIKSDFACYRPGEPVSLSVELYRPKGDFRRSAIRDCRIELHDSADQVVWRSPLPLNVNNTKATGAVTLPPSVKLNPGLYKYHAFLQQPPLELTDSNGFWIYDEALLARGKPLTTDKHFFYRDGQVYPVTGTTYMSSDKHRRYLFEPNPFVWDRDFREMKAAGVNMVRTGIWTGWKKYMPEPGKVTEATLRAFDAFLLTAHKYDIPVIFTFFAFLPETWGGENAYLDPRSVKAQQQFISAFSDRCRHVDDVMWDFINEPSFCSPKYLWNCRPNYDAHEQRAWKEWIKGRYPGASDEELAGLLQEAWRTTRDDVLELPKIQDFESVHLIDERAPLKTLEYRLFAQEMFIRWVRQMTATIRSNGNTKQLITVGQDEGGLGDSPNMQFYAKEIDFTSLHNWWNNDDLLWDSVLGKTPSKLSLMEETGVMFYEKSDGDESWRSEQAVSNLLERKLALSFAADGAGFIEWIWNTNPYMNSTNEVGIGFYRIDGTAKPELEPFLRIAKFMGQYGRYLKDRAPEPVAMLIPHSQMFAPRSFAFDATRRCVRAMYYHCGMPMQAVSEYTLADYAGQAKLIVVPSPRVLTQSCWRALTLEMQRGAVVALTGAFNRDEHWLPVARLQGELMRAKSVEVAQTEIVTIAEREFLLRFEGEKLQRIEKAVVEGADAPVKPIVVMQNSGQLIWSTIPLELSDSMAAVAMFYRVALAQAQLKPVFMVTPQTPAVLVLPAVFRDVVLYTFVSEEGHDTEMQVTHSESKTQFPVLVPAQRTAMVLVERKTGKIIGRL